MRVSASHALAAALVVFVLLVALVPGAPKGASGTSHSRTATSHSSADVAALPRPSASNGIVNWAQYMGGPQHTADNSLERTIAPNNVSNLSEVWNYSTNGSVSSAPIVVNGTVYFGSWAGWEYAVDASNGTREWAKYLNATPDCSVGGIESTPAYSNGSLYLGAPNGTWVSLNASNGSIQWSFLAGAASNGYYDWASALVFGHSLYIGTASCFDSPLVPGTIIQVNLTGNHTANHTWHATSSSQAGTTIWTTSTGDPLTNTVWVTTGNDPGTAQKYAESMVALNATNLAVRGFWQVPNVVGFDSDFGSSATLLNPSVGPPLIVATNKNGVTYAFNRSNVSLANWSPIWSLSTGGGFSGGAFDGTTLYLAGLGGDVYAVDPSNGSVKWHVTLAGGSVYASLTTANGVVYAGGGTTEYALAASNGKTLWSVSPPGATIDGESVVADGRLFVPVGDAGGGHVYAYGLPLAIGANASVPNATNAPQVAEFRGNATGGMTPYQFLWSFDDGGNASGPTVNHTFLVPGNHSGHLTVLDSAGIAVQTNVSVVTTGPPPVLQAFVHTTSLLGEAPFAVWFNGTEVNGTGPTYTWSWNFGDNTSGLGASVEHSFSVGGQFHVLLNLTESGGRYAVASVIVRVVGPLAATATASPSSGNLPLTVQLSAGPSGGRTPYDVSWTFGDGSPTGTGNVVNHTYTTPGTFTATATVGDTFGVHVQTSVVVLTTTAPPPMGQPPLVANPFSSLVSQQCQPNTALFRLTANASGGASPLTEHWSFGDGSASAVGPVVEHNYSSNASYTASLTVVDANGTSVTAPLGLVAPAEVCSHPATSSGSNVGVEELALGAGIGLVLVIAAVLWIRRRRPK